MNDLMFSFQMTESFSSKDNNKKSVVLIEYPRKGVWAVGFATKENKGEMAEKTKKVLGIIEGFKEKPFKIEMLTHVLKIQNLVKEIKS